MNLSKLTNPKAMADYITEFSCYWHPTPEELKKQIIKDVCSDISDRDVVDVYNDYLRNYYPDDVYIEFNDEEIEKAFDSHWDALMACYYGSVNMSDDYFRLNGYGSIETKAANEIVFEAINDDSFIDYLANNPKEASRIDWDLKDVLDFIDNEWEEVEAELKKDN